MRKPRIFVLASLVIISQLALVNAYAQVGTGESPFERKFGDVKFLDAYFGVADEKFEVSPGDRNVPFTVVAANVGTQDITGIKGQLSLPLGFSSSAGPGSIIEADADSNSLAGDVFTLTFFVNVNEQIQIGQFPGSAKIDYSRLRESGLRNSFFDFNFKVTGDSIINMRALDPFLTSLTKNHIIIELSNEGTAPVSGVDIELKNTQGTIGSTTQSVTNVENVIILDSNWDIGHLAPGTSKYIEVDVYVPESLKGETLRAPMEITYFNAHGDRHTITRIVDFYVKGLIDTRIYNVDVIDLSGKQTLIGEIINEGNEAALFGFVTLLPLGDSNIKETTQYIDEIETDSPVPFNIPIEFVGEPRYGEHDVKISVRYKDSVRDERFEIYETTIFLEDLSDNDESGPDFTSFIALAAVAGIGGIAFTKFRKRKRAQEV